MEKEGFEIKEYSGLKKKLIVVFWIAVAIGIIALFVTFIYVPRCSNSACWDYKLERCSKASYVNDEKDITWIYEIKGKKDAFCEVNALAKEIRTGLVSAKVLEGKDMTCMMPLGVIINPELDLNSCYGRLKEEMQGIIIKKLHEYIVSNIGTLNENITKII